jgi:hypothetical protein
MKATSKGARYSAQRRVAWIVLAGALTLAAAGLSFARGGKREKLEPTEGPPSQSAWEDIARIRGHLALGYSPAGAFSPDGSAIAVVERDRVAIMTLANSDVRKVLHPRIPGVATLEIQSANFVSPTSLFVLAEGLTAKGKKRHRRPVESPELAFQWNAARDSVDGKVDMVGAAGGFSPVRYFPHIEDVAVYKGSAFELWNPVTGRGGTFSIAELAQTPHLFSFSPDRRWLVLAQIETNSSFNPIVVSLANRSFVNILPGHHDNVLGMAFSRNSKMVATACADGSVRVFSAQNWNLVRTFHASKRPENWAAFSPESNYVASAGDDATVRVWDVTSGKLVQTLQDSHEPLRTVAFSPNGKFLVSSSENHVYIWYHQATAR